MFGSKRSTFFISKNHMGIIIDFKDLKNYFFSFESQSNLKLNLEKYSDN